MSNGRQTQYIVTLTGNGGGVVGLQVFNNNSRGILKALTIRQEPGGLAGRIASMAFCHNTQNLDLTSTPPREHVMTLVQDVALSASATSADLVSQIDNPEAFSDGLAIIANINAAGAYTLKINLTLEDLRAKGV